MNQFHQESMAEGTPAAPGPTTRSTILQRMLRVMRLDRSVYVEIERDPRGTRQAVWVVTLVAAAVAVGAVLGAGWHAGAIFGAVLAALIHWLVWSGLMYLVARFIFRGPARWHTLRWRLGYAQAPQVLGILSFVPIAGPLVVVASRLLTGIAGHQATEGALGLSRRQQVGTQVVTFAISFVLAALVEASLGGLNLLDSWK